MGKIDFFKKLITDRGVVDITALQFFGNRGSDNDICCICFESDNQSFFLKVLNDSDELIWVDKLVLSDFFLLEKPIELNDFCVLSYWSMSSHLDYNDAVQFEIKINQTGKIAYFQLVAIASRIELLIFYP